MIPSGEHLRSRKGWSLECFRGTTHVVPQENINDEMFCNRGTKLMKSGIWACQVRAESKASRVPPATKYKSYSKNMQQVWEEYFADPSKWWDNRANKWRRNLPDFKHKDKRKALWVADWSTPSWVKAKLLVMTREKVQPHVGHPIEVAQNSGYLISSSLMKRDTLDILHHLEHQGISLNTNDYGNILQQCCKTKDLVRGKQIHAHIVKSGVERNAYVVNLLLRMYAECQRVEDARQIFDNLPKKDIHSWTSMIGAYARNGCGEEAFKLFLQMQEDGFVPNTITYMSILNPCASTGALGWVNDVHTHTLKARLETNVRVCNAFVHMYAKSGSLDSARLVFDSMLSRSIISWNTIIGAYAKNGYGNKAYELFLLMQQEGFVPNAFTYMSILNPCASTGALAWVKDVHTHALKARLETNVRLCNAFVHMYAKSGSLDSARLVFDSMLSRSIISWNTIIGAYAENGYGNKAYELFLQMQQEGFVPNAVTYLSILNPCACAGALEWVKVVHSHAFRAGLESDVRVGSAIVHMYAKSGSLDEARVVFDRMLRRNVISWNMMIGAYAESGYGNKAYDLFLQMQQEGFLPNTITCLNILNPCASTGALSWVKEVHAYAFKAGLDSDVRVGNAFVHMYAKSGSIDDARLVFNRMVLRTVITWNVMIGGLAQHGLGHEAFSLFLQMQRGGFTPNATTYSSILNPCASGGALEWVKEVQSHALSAGLESDVRVGNAFVHMYAKSGSLDDAQLVFDRMVTRDVITWNLMMSALAEHGRGLETLQVYEKMKSVGVKPDSFSFVAVLSACSHAGLVDEGYHHFLAMTQDHGFIPSVVHYNCMVYLLGRAGHLEEANLFIHDMPLEPNSATWGALLGACRIYGNVELGEFAFKNFLKLEPEDASPYVLLSNIYAASGKWDHVSFVRKMMQERGIHKEPGRSWIEVDNKIHYFVVGDKSHPEAKEIYDELNRLTEKMKAEGYIPDTRLVLHNIDEDEKEKALCAHSEKLAISYGLMHTPHGTPIRVYKNLRVCTDCHTATKFISKVTGREIVARDVNRFHHFKDGMCSCGDYW